MRTLKWLVGLITQNFGWKVLSLVIAVAIWILVASEPELSTFANVRVEYRNLPDDIEIASEPVTSVSLELRGPSGELRGLGDAGLRPGVVVEMGGTQPGDRTFPIGYGNVRLPRGVRFVSAVPAEVRFRFERRASRLVMVTPHFIGEGQNGYRVAKWTAVPEQLMIVGPASHVARISSVETDPIDVSPVVGSSDFRVNAFVTDQYIRFVASPQVAITVTMKKNDQTEQSPRSQQP